MFAWLFQPARRLVEALAGVNPTAWWALVAIALWCLPFAIQPLLAWWLAVPSSHVFRYERAPRLSSHESTPAEPSPPANTDAPESKVATALATPESCSNPDPKPKPTDRTQALITERTREYGDLQRRLERWLSDVSDLQSQSELNTRRRFVDTHQVQRAALTLQTLAAELTDMRAEFQQLHAKSQRDRSTLLAAIEQDFQQDDRPADDNARHNIRANFAEFCRQTASQHQLARKKMSQAERQRRQLETCVAMHFGFSKSRTRQALRQSLDR